MVPEERLELMGVPVLDPGRCHDDGPGIERLWFAGKLTHKELNAATGNGQVASAVGHMLLWILCMLQFDKQ